LFALSLSIAARKVFPKKEKIEKLRKVENFQIFHELERTYVQNKRLLSLNSSRRTPLLFDRIEIDDINIKIIPGECGMPLVDLIVKGGSGSR
jgi:hypothetical protein